MLRMKPYFAIRTPEPVPLDALRVLLKLSPGQLVFRLKRQDGGFAIFFQGMGKGAFVNGVLTAEKSRRIRLFAKAETAFGVLMSLGVRSVTVELQSTDEGEFL